MTTWCMAHPIMTFILAWVAVTGLFSTIKAFRRCPECRKRSKVEASAPPLIQIVRK